MEFFRNLILCLVAVGVVGQNMDFESFKPMMELPQKPLEFNNPSGTSITGPFVTPPTVQKGFFYDEQTLHQSSMMMQKKTASSDGVTGNIQSLFPGMPPFNNPDTNNRETAAETTTQKTNIPQKIPMNPQSPSPSMIQQSQNGFESPRSSQFEQSPFENYQGLDQMILPDGKSTNMGGPNFRQYPQGMFHGSASQRALSQLDC